MAWNRTGVFIVPESKLEQANHLTNCFESCMPGAPVFQLGWQSATNPELRYAIQTPALRDESVTKMRAAIASGQIDLPEWATPDMIDHAQAEAMLADTVEHVLDPDAQSIELPADRMLIVFDATVQQIAALAGLERISNAG